MRTNAHISVSQLRNALDIGRAGKIGVVEVAGNVVTFAVFSEDVRESSETVCQAIADSFGDQSEPNVVLVEGGVCRCVFKKDFGEPVRNFARVVESARKCFTLMLDRLRESEPSPCGC